MEEKGKEEEGVGVGEEVEVRKGEKEEVSDEEVFGEEEESGYCEKDGEAVLKEVRNLVG
jgi:hypothetical protein